MRAMFKVGVTFSTVAGYILYALAVLPLASCLRNMRIVPLIAVLLACSDSPTAPLNEDFTIRVGESVTVDGAALMLKFIRVVSDSRCPGDAVCIWAGNGQIQVEARSSTGVDTLTLNTYDGAKEGVAGGNRIRLVSLAPVPLASKPTDPKDYRATFTVSRVGTVCTEEARPALMVALSDSVSPAIATFTNVSIVASEGAYRDSTFMPVYPALPYNGAVPLAYERKGTYQVTVRADGYLTWARSGVLVQRDECHVVTVPVMVRLAR